MTESRWWSRVTRWELLVVVVVFMGAGAWATQFWNTWTAQGNTPEFYQSYFEPAVMVACGRGFVTSTPQPAALGEFLSRRRDTFDCRELPADLKVGREALVTEAWTYLQYTVGWAWRLLGISWSGMGPLFGVLFGGSMAVAYGILRLGMGRVLAMLCVAGLATSPLHLTNLPHLRDYSKAPFTLALVLILGVLVTSPVRRRLLLGLAAAYGAVLGLGYGFRTDLLIDLPVIVAALFLFVEGRLRDHLLLKGLASAVFLATFIVVSWPITSAVYAKGGCQWHVALLGLQSPFEARLGMAPAPYDFGYVYADGYVIRGVQGFARRTQPAGAPTPIYCSHEYDVQSGNYLMALVSTFPADFVARAYASLRQIVEVPYQPQPPPAAAWLAPVFDVRQAVLEPLRSWGGVIAGVALLITSAASIRLGVFLFCFLAYFGGYPAVQFQERHYFHLELIGWWALGCVVQHVVTAAREVSSGRQVLAPLVRQAAFRAAVVIIPGALALGGLLAGARWYQQRQVSQLFAAYIAAPKVPLEDPAARLTGIQPGDWPQFLEIDLDERRCEPRPSVTFRYNAADLNGDFTRTIAVGRPSSGSGLTRIFLPVFESFTGVEVSDRSPGCLSGAYRVTDLGSLPLLLSATLSPDWQSQALYARIGH